MLSITTIGCLLHQLNNGLTLVLLPSQVAPVVAMQAWVSVGSADETSTQAGLSHVMEHMLFKGTAKRGVGAIAQDIESAGGEINAWTSRDNTVFHLVVPSRHTGVGIDVLSDALQSSSFDAQELMREREVVLEEIRQGKDEPMRALAQSMFAGAFEYHPYKNPVIGTEESVSRFTRSDVVRWRDRWYRARNIALIVSGDFDPDAMKAQVEEKFSGLSDGPAPRRRRLKHSPRMLGTARLTTAELSYSQFALSFRAPHVSDIDSSALDLLTVALGQGESSTLSKELVRGQEVCRSSHAYLHALRDHSLVVVGASAESEKLPKALPLIGRLIERLRTELISASDLAKAKHAVWADTVYQRQTAEGMAQITGSYLALTGDADFESKYLQRVAGLTASDLQETAQRILDPKYMNLAALVPTESLAGSRPGVAAKRMLALVHKGAAATSSANVKATRAKRSKPPAVHRHQLDNGMRVLIRRDASVPLVAARAIWSGGSLRERQSNAGISEVMAAALTRGCGRMSAEEIMEEVDSKAASLSGFSGRNSFGLQAEWLAGDWQRGVDLFSECLLSPRFDEHEIERSKRRQLARLRLQQDSPSHQVFRLFQETLFRKHPYRRSSLGTMQSVETLTAAQVQRHYRRHYPTSALTLAIVGDVDPDKVWARIESRFAGKSSTRPARVKQSEVFTSHSAHKREVYGYINREQAHLVVGFPGLSISDSDRHALAVLMTILGGQGGRLFVELRDRQSLAYQVGAYSLEGLDPGYVAIYLSCSPEKVGDAVRAVRAEIDGLLVRGVSPQEMKRAKRHLIGTHEIALQRRSSVAAALAFHDAYGLSYQAHADYPKHVQAVGKAQLTRLIQRIFNWDVAVTATVSPLTMSPEAARRMRGAVRKRRATPKRRRAKGGTK